MRDDAAWGSYTRTLPRDLFNEADLLKCWGRLWTSLDDMGWRNTSIAPEVADDFTIVQDGGSGAIAALGLRLLIDGVEHWVERPLNSRRPWALRITGAEGVTGDFEEIEVFDERGEFTQAMRGLVL